jgi:hypothetical protein
VAFTLEQAKAAFFDRDAIKKAADRGTRRALSKFGAFVRTRARSSIRKRKAISKPGAPPSSHTGTLRKGILFGYDAARKSVVIGPVLLGSQNGAPERLEEGGVGLVGRRKPRLAFYRPRPFMGPAFAAELPKAPALLKDMIH